MWQALYPDSYVEPMKQTQPSWSYPVGTVLDASSRKRGPLTALDALLIVSSLDSISLRLIWCLLDIRKRSFHSDFRLYLSRARDRQ